MSDNAGTSKSTANGGESASNPRKRKYGNSCTACRQKKRSCDGQRPRCSNCVASEELECIIPEVGRPLRRNGTAATIQTQPDAPPMSIQESLVRLTEHMSRVEQRLHHIERGSQAPSDGYTEVDTYRHGGDVYDDDLGFSSGLPNLADMQQSLDDGGTAMPLSTIPPQSGSHGAGGAEYRLTTDETGNITYHGVTALNSGSDIPISPSLVSQAAAPAVPIPSLAESVSQNQALAPIFQALAASKHISVAPELGDALLSAFHCYEVFEITEQASFLRDMVLGGPCYSELLLMVLYASASRMIDGLTEEQKLAQGDLFVKLAKAYLWKEMDGPTKITTIQSLLLLSSRECALGEVSQGWNHAGLAFRMIQDLGIHHHPDSVSGVSNLSLEEQAMRDRLFWAAFIWDKTLSLALGREPTLGPRPGGDPAAIPDFTNEDEPWTPYFVHPLNCPPSLQGYVYPRSSRSTVFRLLSRLCVIVHDIMMGLYGTESRDNVPHVRAAFVAKTQKRMDELWHDVPAHLDPWPETFSPPPHVFMFLIFIHASYILLNRPIVSSHDIATATGPAAVCLQHSIQATAIAVRFTKTFGDYMRYLPRYCWFVAASFDIVILDSNVHAVQEAALDRLSIWLRTMTKNLLRAPSMRKSVQHISSKIYEVLVRNPMLAQSSTGTAIFAHLRGQRGATGMPSPMNGFGNEGFGFFELLQNT